MNVIDKVLNKITPLKDTDRVGRLNFFFTTLVLVLFSAFIGGWAFVGHPITCWYPANFKREWQEYANNVCFISNKYYQSSQVNKTDWSYGINLVNGRRLSGAIKERYEIGYYQWMPFVFTLQALFLWITILFWRHFYDSFSLRIEPIFSACAEAKRMDDESREMRLTAAAHFLVQHHYFNKKSGRRFSDNAVPIYYMITKFLFLLNNVGQFVFLKVLIGSNDLFWGWTAAKDLWNGEDWQDTGRFPRVTVCDFSIRTLNNIERHSVQCVLMLNVFNEKILLFLWFWFGFLVTITAMSLVSWTLSYLSSGRGLVAAYVRRIDADHFRSLNRKSNRLITRFINKKLQANGLFLIRLIEGNYGEAVPLAILKILWNDFKDERPNDFASFEVPGLIEKDKKKSDDNDLLL